MAIILNPFYCYIELYLFSWLPFLMFTTKYKYKYTKKVTQRLNVDSDCSLTADACSEPCQTSKMEYFAKIIND